MPPLDPWPTGISIGNIVKGTLIFILRSTSETRTPASSLDDPYHPYQCVVFCWVFKNGICALVPLEDGALEPASLGFTCRFPRARKSSITFSPLLLREGSDATPWKDIVNYLRTKDKRTNNRSREQSIVSLEGRGMIC